MRAAAFHEGPLRKAIHRLKYQYDIGLAEALALLLEDCWRAHDLAADLIVPVPLAPGRRQARGFNQAGLLAEALAARVKIPVAPRALWRVRETPSQIGRGWADRYANVIDAFRADANRVRGRRVALVDDVCTSGATLAASALALQAGGAAGVWGVAVARPRRSPDNAVNSEAR